MSRNSSGTYSLPAGNPVVSGTTISSTVANATLADVGAELTDSLSRSGKGGMTAPFRVVDGTVAAPSLSFTSETGSGLYRAGASDVGVAVAGTRRLRIQATGVTVPDDLTVTGAASVGSTLGAGATTLASLGVTGAATVGTTLGVTGDTTLTGNLGVNGATGLTLSAGDVLLTEAGNQAITKSGSGNLTITGASGGNVAIVAHGETWTFSGSNGNLDAGANTITNLQVTPSNDSDAATKKYVDDVAAPLISAVDTHVATTDTCTTSGTTIFTVNYNLGSKIRFRCRFYMASGPTNFAFRGTPTTTAVDGFYINAWGGGTATALQPTVTWTTGTATNTTGTVGITAKPGILEVEGAVYVLGSGSTGSIAFQIITVGASGTLQAGSWYSYGFDNP